MIISRCWRLCTIAVESGKALRQFHTVKLNQTQNKSVNMTSPGAVKTETGVDVAIDTSDLPEQVIAKLKAVETVEIDPSGKFKYVLIKLYHPDHEKEYKYLVRGAAWAEFHGNNIS